MKIRPNINFDENKFLMFVMDDLANHKEYDKNEDVIRLTLGKSELPLHDNIINEMCNVLRDPKKSSLVYPAGLPQLQMALSEYYKHTYNTDIAPHKFIISPGTSTLFRNLFTLLLKPGDEVLLPRPYYSLYHFCALLAGATIRYYQIDIPSGKLNIKSFNEQFSPKTKVVVINSPGNPLGNILSDDDIRKMDEISNGQAVFISDEIYSNSYFDYPVRSSIQLKDTKSVFIPTNAFSKAYRMYSRRVGYCICPDELIEPLTVIQHHTLLTVDPVVQFGAIAALQRPQDVSQLVKLYKARRDYTIEKLSSVPFIEPVYSSGGFYITILCSEYMKRFNFSSSLQLATKIFELTNVAVVPGSDFGLEGTIRLSFSSNQYTEGIDRLAWFFKTYQHD